MHPSSSRIALSLVALVLAAAAGCGDDETAPVVGTCAPEDQIDGVCAGVPVAAVCDTDVCTSDVTCARTVEASDAAGLTAAVAGSSAGTCIALHPGSYPAVTLPGGVSLLGKSADAVSIAGVVVGPGDGSVLRGLGVGAGGVLIDNATGTRIESVRVSKATETAVNVVGPSSVVLVTSTLAGAGHYGLLAGDGADVTVDGSVVASGEGPGVWVACDGGCACASQPKLTMTGSVVRDNRIAGINVAGAAASIAGVDVKGTKVGDTWHYGEGGGGVSVSACSNVVITGLRVADSKSYGVLVDASTAKLGGPAANEGLTISGNLMGIWIQDIAKDGPQSFSLDSATVEGNQGVGIGVAGETVGIIIICKTAVTGTKKTILPVFENEMDLGTTKEVGDGLEWLNGAELQVDGLTLSGNERASLLIDGPAKGTLQDVTLSGGDDAKGIVQQSYSMGDTPAVSGSTPAVTTSTTEVFTVPKGPVLVKTL